MGKKHRRVIAIGFVLFLLTAAFWSMEKSREKEESLQSAIAQKILRFHVIANSDGDRDQEVKERVRDAIGAQMGPYLEQVENIEETRQIVENHMDEIVEVAEETLLAYGYDYGATAALVHTEFPEKSYGSYTFPAGEYEALQVILGEGKGHNWWCVLYPNMCFRGSIYEIIEDSAGEALREVLTTEEYAGVVDSGKFKFRFKFLEYFR